MQRNKKFSNSFLEKIVSSVAFLSGLFILFPLKIKPIIVLAFLAFLFIFKINKENLKKVFVVSILFFIYTISLIYCFDVKTGSDYIIRLSPLLIIPFCYSLIPDYFQNKFKTIFYKAFILSASLYVLLVFIYMYSIGFFSGEKDLNVSYSFIINCFWGINEHPIYISIILSIAMLILLEINFQSKKIKYFLFTVLLIGLLLMARKAVIISFFLVSFFLVILRKTKRERFFLILFMIGMFLLSIFIPAIRLRYLELYNYQFVYNENSSTGIRQILWENAISLIKEAFFTGYSVGDVQAVIANQLYNEGYLQLAENNLNMHNQYIQTFLTVGFVGFAIYLISLFYLIRGLILSKNQLGIALITFFLLNFITESILYRQNGIILFSLFSSIIYINHEAKKKRIAIIGPFPGPIKGVSLSNITIFNAFIDRGINTIKINTESSDDVKTDFGTFTLSKLKFIKCYFASYKILFSDIVYITIGISFFGVLKYAPFILLSKVLNKKLIVHVHSDHLKNEYLLLNGVKKVIFHKLLSLFDKGIVLSESLIDNLSPFLDSSKIYCVYNFYEDKLILDQKEIQYNKDFSEVRLFYMSNLIKEKGINNLLESIQMLNNDGIYPKLKIAGNKVLSNNLDNLLSELKNVEYVGVVLNEKKSDLLLWGNVFCLPTYYSMEGQPISIIESMAFNNFILTTKHAGIPDICSEQNAVFCNKNDSLDLYKKLLFIYKNWNEIQSKAISNGVLAREKFTEKAFIDKIEKIVFE